MKFLQNYESFWVLERKKTGFEKKKVGFRKETIIIGIISDIIIIIIPIFFPKRQLPLWK